MSSQTQAARKRRGCAWAVVCLIGVTAACVGFVWCLALAFGVIFNLIPAIRNPPGTSESRWLFVGGLALAFIGGIGWLVTWLGRPRPPGPPATHS